MKDRVCLLMMLGLLVASGCSRQGKYMGVDRLERGLVVVLPGIEGRGPLNADIAEGLDEGGVNWGIEIWDWTSPWGELYNLRAQERNRDQARELAFRINRYRTTYPERPVVLVGMSGGAAIGVWAAESLHPEQLIDGAILINAALSPTYNLTPALGNTKRGIVSFHSDRDWVLLGVGTQVFGTMDGKHTAGAGKVGFEIPPSMPDAYTKLYRIGWTRDMARTGHGGGHLSSAAKGFVSRYVAPLVLAREWSPDVISKIQRDDPRLETGGSPISPSDEPVDTWRPISPSH
jgi:pimeloyl-ACP methyl ester carboxylesterase